MRLIMAVAASDPRIRVVLQNGSRSNPNVTKDIFQDYDIIYVVTDLSSFVNDYNWINVFGERMILQMPEDMELYPPTPELAGAFSYLMQFVDGNRIDLILAPIDKLNYFLEDSLCKLLLDKDGVDSLTALEPSSDKSYLVSRPSVRAFNDCCNEFWYTNAGLAKSLWREQILSVKHLFCHVIQDTLIQMLDWYIGCRYDFSVNPGKFGKYYKEFLEPEIYSKLLSTYKTADLSETWNAIYLAIDLFDDVAKVVADQLGFKYSSDERRRITTYLQHVQQLPKSAKKMY